MNEGPELDEGSELEEQSELEEEIGNSHFYFTALPSVLVYPN